MKRFSLFSKFKFTNFSRQNRFLKICFVIIARSNNHHTSLFSLEEKMKKLITLALCASTFMFFGCAKAGLKNVDPSWTEPATSVTVLYTQPLVKNGSDVTDDLPEYADNFSGWMEKRMGEEFQKQAGVTAKFEQKEAGAFNFAVTKLGKKEFSIPSPKFDEVEGLDGLVLTISNFEVDRISETKMTGPTSAETRTYLQYSGEYSYAKAAEKQVVTSGTFKARVGLGFAMTKGDWDKNVENLVEELIKDTPLQKK